MIEIGKIFTLKVTDISGGEIQLESESGEIVSMPENLAAQGVSLEDDVRVFVYIDEKGLPIATMETPAFQVNEFSVLKVKENTDDGTLLEWGLKQDLLLPFRVQYDELYPGEKCLVRLCFDAERNELYASARYEDFIEEDTSSLVEKSRVKLIAYAETPLGFKVIVEDKFKGMIYHNEVFKSVTFGQVMHGHIKNIREDNRLDIILQKEGMAAIRSNRDIILEALQNNNGRLNISDKSSPDEIKATLALSKLAFKKAVGSLYKERRVVFVDGGIELINIRE